MKGLVGQPMGLCYFHEYESYHLKCEHCKHKVRTTDLVADDGRTIIDSIVFYRRVKNHCRRYHREINPPVLGPDFWKWYPLHFKGFKVTREGCYWP